MSCFAGCLAGICGGSSVKASWKNHFDAFAAQDVPKILADYTDRSEVYVYDYSTGGLSTYKGLSGVTDLFNGLFKTLSDTSELAAPLIEVEQWRGGGMVFLVWLCPSSGYPLVTDTFIFDKGFKILRQNIVSFKSVHEAYWPPSTIHNLPSDVTGNPSVSASWDNHFAAFAEQDVGKILKDYTNRSLVQVYDFSATQNTKYKGLKGVTELFNGLFTTLSDTSGLKAPVIKVEQWEGGGMVFLVWMCDTSGLPLVTDTFIFDANFKILRQNIVSWPKAN